VEAVSLNNQTKSRISSLGLLITLFMGIYLIRVISPNLIIDPFTWVLLIFAASMGGAAVAYMAIGESIRSPLTKEVSHSSRASMIEIEPKYEGWLKSPGLLLCCPICAGTWVGVGLLGLMAVDFTLGYYVTLVMATAGAARVVIRLSELLEWQSRYAQERTAQLNRLNAEEEHAHHQVPSYPMSNGRAYWLVKEEEEIKQETNK
jgi:hypothetical protein